jgi:hypothetical protein
MSPAYDSYAAALPATSAPGWVVTVTPEGQSPSQRTSHFCTSFKK